MRVRLQIVAPASEGLQEDARVLVDALARVSTIAFDVDLVTVPDQIRTGDLATPASTLARFDFQIRLQNVWIDPALRGLARHVILIPNPDFTIADDIVAAAQQQTIHSIWAKTRSTIEWLPRELPIATHFSGWTSSSPRYRVRSTRSFGRFLHVRGKSWLKQTQAVVDAWLANPAFPPLDIVMQDRVAFAKPLRCGPNLTIHQRQLPRRELRALQADIGIHLCPSLVEGFGHYINEARSTGALVMTTDGAPMNELVDDTSGCLIAASRRAGIYTEVDGPQVEAAVERVLGLSTRARHTLGLAARARYLAERTAFHRRVDEVFRTGSMS